MNLIINPIYINSQAFKKADNKKQAIKQEFVSKNLLPDYKTSLFYKNQILFTSNLEQVQRQKQLQGVIDKYNLKISPEKLDYVLNPEKIDDKKKIKEAKKGSRIFTVFARGALYRKYPNKSEDELTSIMPSCTKDRNKARLLRTLIPEELLQKDSNKSQVECFSHYFNSLLGAIVEADKEEGYRDAYKFLSDFVEPSLVSPFKNITKNDYEQLQEVVEARGKSYDDVHVETKLHREDSEYRVFYKNQLLSEVIAKDHDKELRIKAIQNAIEGLKSGEIILDGNKTDKKPYKDYTVPDKKRIKRLDEFQERYNLKFDNINLLHQAFLYGTMPDRTIVPHLDSYEILEFIGDAVLDFCGREVLQNNLAQDISSWVIGKKQGAFARNSNLAVVSKKMGLGEYAINIDSSVAKKRQADLFEALLGAIYVDGGEDGLNRAYNFLNDNLKDDMLRM